MGKCGVIKFWFEILEQKMHFFSIVKSEILKTIKHQEIENKDY